MLRTFAGTIAKVWDTEREGFRDNLGDDPNARRALLIRVARNRHITLTEAGWAWIDAETDLEVLDLLMLLLAINERALSFTNFRRALFEHRHLCARLRDITVEQCPPSAAK